VEHEIRQAAVMSRIELWAQLSYETFVPSRVVIGALRLGNHADVQHERLRNICHGT
jgi:hypothetical protein